MRLVEVDVVGLQAAERGFDCLANVLRLQTFAAFPHVHADLGCKDQVIATAALREPLADDGLGFAALVSRSPAGIHVGSIDEVQSKIECLIELPTSVGLGRVQP
jgi:hypothetical protein